MLRTRLKRLLESDRALGRVSRANDPARANYAFFSADAQGSGVEVWFSEYEAFSLLNGLRLMEHGWPQSFAVSIMRRVRADLEKDHARILKQDRLSDHVRSHEGDTGQRGGRDGNDTMSVITCIAPLTAG